MVIRNVNYCFEIHFFEKYLIEFFVSGLNRKIRS